MSYNTPAIRNAVVAGLAGAQKRPRLTATQGALHGATPGILASGVAPFTSPNYSLADNLEAQRKYVSAKAQKNHVYFKVGINPGNEDGVSTPSGYLPMTAVATFSEPLVDKSSEYALSVIEASISTLDMPVMIVPITVGPGKTNINETVFSVTIYDVTLNAAYVAPVIWVPQFVGQPTPIAPTAGIVTQDVSSKYYYLQDFSYFIDLINAALKTAITAAIAAVGSTIPAGSRAWMAYESGNSQDLTPAYRFALYGTAATFDESPGTPPAPGTPLGEVYMNSDTYSLFRGLTTQVFTASNVNATTTLVSTVGGFVPDGSDLTYLASLATNQLASNRFNNGGVASPTGTFIRSVTQYEALNNWLSFNAIVIKTTSVPVRRMLSTAAVEWGQGFIGPSAPTAAASDGVLLRFTPGDDVGFETVAGSAYYKAVGPPVYVDLVSEQGFRAIDIVVGWEDIYGNYHQLDALPHSSTTVYCQLALKTLLGAVNA